MHVVVGTQWVCLGKVAQLERIDEMESVFQRSGKLGGRGQMAVQLLDEEHDVDGDGAVEGRGQRGKVVLHLRVRRGREGT